jgi:alpha-L-fucosidase
MSAIPSGPFNADWQSLQHYQVPAWYRDGKFGIFIHWGPYCVPAFSSEWYPRMMYMQGSKEYTHHLTTYGPHNQFGYKDFIPLFKAERFDANQWAELFAIAGARFVVPVAEHHDGFAMYETALNRWNAANMGPKRDIIGELAQATRRHGMVFGLSSHRAEHWFFFEEGRKFSSDVNDPANADLYGPAQPSPTDWHQLHSEERPDEAFIDDWVARCTELVDKYQPQLFWFDWWIQHKAWEPALQQFAAYYYNRAAEWDKGVAINYKYDAFAPGSAVFDIERGQVTDIYPQFWQNDTSVAKNSWGFTNAQDYKTPANLINDLIDVVSKNGALLLNIGPKADGTIPDHEVYLLHEIGAWLRVNGEAIYASTPWHIYGEGPTRVADGAFTDTNRADFTGADIRYTCHGDTLYAIVMAWPGAQATLPALKLGNPYRTQITTVELLGYDYPLTWHQTADALVVDMPERPIGQYAVTLRIR